MATWELSVAQVQRLIPSASDIREVGRGGQKIVFSGILDKKKYALKFLSLGRSSDDISTEPPDAVVARAEREVKTMIVCANPHLVRMGPIKLQRAEIEGVPIIYFTEEFIEGTDLLQLSRQIRQMDALELLKLATHISRAIGSLWKQKRIHRDIKPGNIMRNSKSGNYILLDMGFVFDLDGESLSKGTVGTPIYLSPEQLDFERRRSVMNFRSDLFSLGIVMYEMATGQHPFLVEASTQQDVLRNIVRLRPKPPNIFRPDLSDKLNGLIMRLLEKQPSLRFRTIELFQHEIQRAGF